MAKQKSIYVCRECGAAQAKWLGRCPVCQAWDSLDEEIVHAPAGGAAVHPPATIPLTQAGGREEERTPVGVDELDRVLGGGLVPGMIAVIGGEPGIGKSTLMLQLAARIGRAGGKVLYASAEESAHQVGLRAQRLAAAARNVDLLAETSLEPILACLEAGGYSAAVIDSVQAVRSSELGGAAGTISQVRHCAALLAALGKRLGLPIFLVGHVTKEGSLAGPRVLEHLVDTVLHFESEPSMRLRLLRAVKNRFGATDEVGVFEMTEKGLVPVSDPSRVLLAHRPEEAPGSAVCAAVSGTRPLLVEVQALVSPSGLAVPRRQALGVDPGRLAMLCAVLSIHAGLDLGSCDVFVNVAGGLRLTEPGADLAVAVAMASSLSRRPVPRDMVCFGEIGLAGELRAVGRGQARMNEAARQGFGRVLCAPGKDKPPKGLQVLGAARLAQALEMI